MSGGTWGYMEHKIRGDARRVKAYLEAVASTESLIDWAEAGDSDPEKVKTQVYDLWVKVFNET